MFERKCLAIQSVGRMLLLEAEFSGRPLDAVPDTSRSLAEGQYTTMRTIIDLEGAMRTYTVSHRGSCRNLPR